MGIYWHCMKIRNGGCRMNCETWASSWLALIRIKGIMKLVLMVSKQCFQAWNCRQRWRVASCQSMQNFWASTFHLSWWGDLVGSFLISTLCKMISATQFCLRIYFKNLKKLCNIIDSLEEKAIYNPITDTFFFQHFSMCWLFLLISVTLSCFIFLSWTFPRYLEEILIFLECIIFHKICYNLLNCLLYYQITFTLITTLSGNICVCI